MYGEALKAKGYPAITTEIVDAPPFYFAEDYHQQYLAKNPDGYCGLRRDRGFLPDRDRRRSRLAGNAVGEALRRLPTTTVRRAGTWPAPSAGNSTTLKPRAFPVRAELR